MLVEKRESYVITGVDYKTYSGKKYHLDFKLINPENLKKERIFSGSLKVTKEIVLDILVDMFKVTNDPIVSISKLYTNTI